jgi:hypothetical protein
MKPLDTFYTFWRCPADCSTAILRNGCEPLLLPLAKPFTLSATRFEWGYEGIGPQVTTEVLLADFLEDGGRALKAAWQVKVRLVAKLPVKGAVVTASELLWVVTEIEDERAGIKRLVAPEPEAETHGASNLLRRLLRLGARSHREQGGRHTL